MDENDVLSWAKKYVNLGWYVFPLHTIIDGSCSCGNKTCSDAGKHPRLARGLKNASRDLAEIEKWFGSEGEFDGQANIGIVTGELSGITVIDIDIAEGKLGADTWQTLCEDHGEPQTLSATTGSGGIHFIFKYSSSLKTSSNTLGKGVDCRNDRGYIVAAPSLHRSGGVYEWDNWQRIENGGLNGLAFLPAHLAHRKDGRGRPAGSGESGRKKSKKWTIDQVARMLEFIQADDRDLWRHVGIILGREYKCSDEAWQTYSDWSDSWGGTKGRNHDEIMREAFYDISKKEDKSELSIGTIVKLATENGWAPLQGDVPIERFVYYAPGNCYIYRPTFTQWISAAVDAAVSPVNMDGKILPASDWLKQNMLSTSLCKNPSIDEDYIKGFDCSNGEMFESVGAAVYNSYRKPNIELGDSKLAKPFIEHVHRVFNKSGDAKQFLDYMAHRVQHPADKPRFALLIAGGQGVGKDTCVEMCTPAIGGWNISNIEPSDLESNFNEYAAMTLVRISEAANLHEMTKWAFNEKTKVLIAGNPDNCTINPKYGQKFDVKMFCGVIVTTNHLASGIYIPPDDRRYDVIESATMTEMELDDDEAKKKYFTELWEWFYEGGLNHIAAYLYERDVSSFNASTGQRKTAAHAAVVASGMSGDHWLIDALDSFDGQDYIRADHLIAEVLRQNQEMKPEAIRVRVGAAVSRQGFSVCRNVNVKDGRWKITDDSGITKKVIVYIRDGTVDLNSLKNTPECLRKTAGF